MNKLLLSPEDFEKKLEAEQARTLRYKNLLYSHQEQGKEIERLGKELHQQRFNNEHNLSIDQKISDEIQALRFQLIEANEVIGFYASPLTHVIPEIDENGFGGMSSRSRFEIHDKENVVCPIKGEEVVYLGGKRAREYQKKWKVEG